MSEAVHKEVFENLAAYALGALSLEERAQIAAHVEECPVCAEDAAALQRAAARLGDDVPQVQPPPELRDRIMAVVESEAALLRPAREPAPAPRRRASWSGLVPRLAAGLAVLAIGLAVGASVLDGEQGADTRTLAAEVGRGHAWVEVTDDRAHLVVDGLAAPDKGKVYELWIQRGEDAPRPASEDIEEAVFVVRSGRVEIPARLEAGDRIMVTEEPAGGSGVPTADPIVVTERV